MYEQHVLKALMSKAKDEDQLSLLSLLYAADLTASKHSLNIPSDYLWLSLLTFKHLKGNGRVNILHKLAKAIGEVRSDASVDTKLPCKQMPVGLLEHTANFLLLSLISR